MKTKTSVSLKNKQEKLKETNANPRLVISTKSLPNEEFLYESSLEEQSTINIVNNNETKPIILDEKEKIKQIEVKIKSNIQTSNNKKEILKNYGLLYLKVSKIVVVNDKTKLYRLIPIYDEKLPLFKSGQYIEIKTNWNGQLYSRNFSICSSPAETKRYNYYEIIVQNEERSIVSRKLYNEWRVGSSVVCSNPEGHFYFWKDHDKKKICAIASGVGNASILSLAKSIVVGDEDIELFIFNYGYFYDDLLFSKQYKKLIKLTNKIRYINVLLAEDIPGCEFGFIDYELLKTYLDIQDYTFYVCGPKKVCTSILNKLK